MKLVHLLPFLSILPIVSGAQNAQEASDPGTGVRVSSAAIDHDRLYFDVQADGTVWVRGRTFKAHFAQDGTTYIPYFGPEAPRNYPVTFDVASVTIGGEPIAFDREAPAVRHGDAIEYERGSFRERYVLTKDSVEQTFVFDSLPRRGEIVVNLAVATDLQRATDEQGLRYENELGHVRYGNAFAFDERVDATPISSRTSAGGVELIVPASLVSAAVGRLVIDPVLSTQVVSLPGWNDFAADTAFDSTSQHWMTIFEEVYSATDHDIVAVRHPSAGAPGSPVFVDSSGDDWRAPAIANNNVDDQFLVVAARGAAPSRQIWARTVEATASMVMSAPFRISDPSDPHDAYAPDVGGDRYTVAPTTYCVVWERQVGTNYEIDARLVRPNTILAAPGQLLLGDASSKHRNPSISNLNGSSTDVTRHWNVVWEDEVTPTNHNILGRRIRHDGVLPEAMFSVASSVLDERNPSASSILVAPAASRPWMAAYQIDSGANGWDVRCRSFEGTTSLSTFDLSAQFPTVALDQITPSCDTGGGQFVVAYDERPSPLFGSTDIKAATLYAINGALALNEGDLSASPGLHLDQRPRVATRGYETGFTSDAMIVFDRDAGVPNEVYVTTFDIPNGGPISVACPGDGSGTACPCGNVGAAGHGCASSVNPAGAELVSTGSCAISFDTLQLEVTGLPATAPLLLFQGTGQSLGGAGAPFGDGLRCASGIVVRLSTKTAIAGVASYPGYMESSISVRGVIPAEGAVRYYQAWYRNSASFCTPSTFNLTNGLRVVWIP